MVRELKKELEKYAVEIIRMQEMQVRHHHDSNSFAAINETFNEDDEDIPHAK